MSKLLIALSFLIGTFLLAAIELPVLQIVIAGITVRFGDVMMIAKVLERVTQ